MAVTTSRMEVLEFSLADERYCVELQLVNEIVRTNETLRRLPDAAPSVIGVMDLRGETTKIIDPSRVLAVDTDKAPEESNNVIVFDVDPPIGWVVDEVHQVIPIPEEDVDESVSNDLVNGILTVEDRFSIWVEPDEAT